MVRYFDINTNGHSIKCKITCDNIRELQHIVIYAHGFGGHKDNKAAEHFAESIQAKMKKVGVLCFDLPCHGTDVKKKLLLEDCFTYFDYVLDYVKNEWPGAKIYLYATSFGGFLAFHYIKRNGNPFVKAAFRCPALKMYDAFAGRILTEENKELLDKGKDILAGFDRKVRIDKPFLEEVKGMDVTELDMLDFADDILIIHGTSDEIIPCDVVKKFADDNVIECIIVENADHRFKDLDKLKLAHSHMIDFYKGVLE